MLCVDSISMGREITCYCKWTDNILCFRRDKVAKKDCIESSILPQIVSRALIASEHYCTYSLGSQWVTTVYACIVQHPSNVVREEWITHFNRDRTAWGCALNAACSRSCSRLWYANLWMMVVMSIVLVVLVVLAFDWSSILLPPPVTPTLHVPCYCFLH